MKKLLPFLAFIAFAAPAWAEHQEIQAWLGVEAETKAKELPLKFKIRDEVRLSNCFAYNHLETTLGYEIVEGIGIGIGYRAAIKQSEDIISSEQRPFFDFKIGWEAITIREQVAYCFYSVDKFEWIFRTKGTVDFGKQYPYGYWEIFVRQEDSLYRSRLYLGYRFDVYGVGVDAGLFWQMDKKNDEWSHFLIICLTLTVKV